VNQNLETDVYTYDKYIRVLTPVTENIDARRKKMTDKKEKTPADKAKKTHERATPDW